MPFLPAVDRQIPWIWNSSSLKEIIKAETDGAHDMDDGEEYNPNCADTHYSRW
jgi:hypothetical protein